MMKWTEVLHGEFTAESRSDMGEKRCGGCGENYIINI
jgi:hypothetical protein